MGKKKRKRKEKKKKRNYVMRLVDKTYFLRAFIVYGEETQRLNGGGQTAKEFSSLVFRRVRGTENRGQ